MVSEDGNVGPPIRAFVAFEIPEPIKRAIALRRRDLVGSLPRARWVRPEGQHLTLKFLGDTGRDVLTRLEDALRERLCESSPVTIQLEGCGFFPSAGRPRVAWIGGRATGAGDIARVVDEAAGSCGFERDRRRWSIHLTQARIKEPWPADAAARFLKWGEELGLEPFEAAEVVVFSSELRPTGAVYTALGRVPLG
jgi:2'-5' RNA ligase